MTRIRNTEPGTWLLASLLTAACAAPCLDDGLVQDACDVPATPPGPQTAEGTTSSSNDDGAGDDRGQAEGGASGSSESTAGVQSSSADTTAGHVMADGSDDGETSDVGNGGPWCLDLDGDGFGDPAWCSDRPGPGTVDNDEDCNDADVDTFPGAAELEPDPQACTTDADGDGWGDAMPADGAVAGADCWDDEPALNPTSVRMGTIDNGPLDDVAALVDENDATLTVIAPIDTPLLGWSTTAAALRHDGEVIVMEEISARLQRIQYQGVCDGTSEAGEAMPIGPDLSNLSLCGLSFDMDDHLWGIDAQTDSVLEFDPDSGAPLSSTPLTLGGAPLELSDCDLTWDCHAGHLLVADAAAGHVLSLEPASGQVEPVAEYEGDLGAVGMAYDPVARVVFVSSGIHLNLVPLDGTAASEIGTLNYEGAMVADAANLVPLRICE